MTQFDPVLMDEIRETLGLDAPRAIEHVWYAVQALKASGTQVVIKSVEALAQLTSAELTMQMLAEKYSR